MTNSEIMNVVKPVICSKLKSPASAQFPVDLISITGDDTSGYQVNGFVDSQNSYGAMIRNDFNAQVNVLDGVLLIYLLQLVQKHLSRTQNNSGSTI